MYRQYEDPYQIERWIREIEDKMCYVENDYELMRLGEELAELKDRERFAWDDDEYEMCYA